MAAVQVWTGREARYLRQALRMSQRDFANYLGYNDAAVSNWERRGVNAKLRTQTQRDLDTALTKADDDARERFFSALELTHAGAPSDTDASVEPHGAQLAEWWPRFDPSGPAGLNGLSIRKPTPTAVGWTEVEQVRFITRMLALSENTYGGGLSGEAAAAQLRYSAGLVQARATDDVRRAMFEAVGNLGEVVGFSAFDVADFASAHHCFRFALWCADEARSWSLRASALSDMSRLATYLGRFDDASSLIELAQKSSHGVSATARAMLSALRARLLALHGRHTEANAEVDRSDGYFAERNVAEDPPWLCYYDRAEHEGSTGRALIPIAQATNDVGLVIPRLENAVRLHDRHHPRSREFSRTRLASLLMAVGEVREAAAAGRTALAQSASLRSSRLHSELRQLGELAAAHQHIPDVADLRHKILTQTAPTRG